MKYRKKPIEIEAITWEEFVEFGKKQSPKDAKEHNGMAWSFEYNGHAITHKNDECYLIPTLEGTHNMTPDDMLITGVKGEIYPCKKDIFELTYELTNKNHGSFGCKRVKAEFNPAKNDVVDKIKNKSAELINLLQSIRPIGSQAEKISSEKQRIISIAQTEVETGCMYGVKACFTD